ncbi:MAG: M50 family metallopeptidase [Deltaproteobacteria bacterium]|nr:M50 family metallopeptidase [Deltaproteobacteria bacterium]
MSTPTAKAPERPKPRVDPRALPPDRAALSSQARWVLAGCTVVTLALYLTPSLQVLAWPLVFLSTMVHEMGHGVAALFVGTWHSLHMFSDASGYAMCSKPEGVASAFVSAGGLCGPAVAAALFLVLGLRPRLARWCLGLTGGFFALTLVLWTRGVFGWVAIAIVAATCLAIALRASAEVAQIALVFLATQLALSVYSRGDYLFTKEGIGQMSDGKLIASDTQRMAEALGGTYWLWGLVCAAFSAAVLAGAAWLYFRPRRAAAARALS